MLLRSRRALLLAGVLMVSLLPLSCGGEKENGGQATAPAETKASGGEKVQGVTDTEILLGTHYPLSNSPAAVYAVSAYAMQAYFDYINDQGGVHGRKIKLIIEDDQYSPTIAVEAVRNLVEQNKVFAIANGLGDPACYATYQYLERKGIPDILLGGGIVAFSEPPGKLRTVSIPDYGEEAKGIATYLQEHYAGSKVGLLVQSDESGTGTEKILRQYVKEANLDLDILDTEYYDYAEFDMTGQAQRMKAKNPDVVVFLSIPTAAASFAKAARQLLNWDVPFIANTVGGGDFYIALAGPEVAEGTVWQTFGSPLIFESIPGVQKFKEVMQEYRPDLPLNTQTVYGYSNGAMIVKSLEDAGRNLTPESLMKGMESTKDWCCELCFAPVSLSPNDHKTQETEFFTVARNGKWEFTGEYVSWETTPSDRKICPLFQEQVPNNRELLHASP